MNIPGGSFRSQTALTGGAVFGAKMGKTNSRNWFVWRMGRGQMHDEPQGWGMEGIRIRFEQTIETNTHSNLRGDRDGVLMVGC